MNEPILYHGTPVGGIGRLEPRQRFTSPTLGDDVFPAVYAADAPAYPAGHAFPWSSAEGIDLGYEDGQLVLAVPVKQAERLNQKVYLYALPPDTFEPLPNVPPEGRNYRSRAAVVPLGVSEYGSVREAVEASGGGVRVTE
jgi:hypothetical protein